MRTTGMSRRGITSPNDRGEDEEGEPREAQFDRQLKVDVVHRLPGGASLLVERERVHAEAGPEDRMGEREARRGHGVSPPLLGRAGRIRLDVGDGAEAI